MCLNSKQHDLYIRKFSKNRNLRLWRKFYLILTISLAMIHFSKKKSDLNFTDQFLKCGNYHKSRFYE
ncbi:hypothetical protein B1J93_06595 [Leptospira kirschneri serovar Pomona]|uniref:Uncharacterized protein n=1 Tax=Leptospira kirschneri serovar Pomona TaxID=561005 RepID=A0A1T1DTD7_9LEPT|nr:hypothetical protein B1J93_06595 [Leptospira kirschneri serovar Pomona]